MQRKIEANRYIQLTETGLKRFHEARRRYRKTIEDIVHDSDTPSINTIKKTLKREPVFINTLEKIWGFLQRCAQENRASLPDLAEGVDYAFVEGASRAETILLENPQPSQAPESRRGWLSRQTPGPNRLFLGRKEVLARLHAALQAGPAALVPDPQALTGLGGIGKTQTAIAYIYAHWNDYNGIFWVNAETVESLDEGLAGLAEELHLLNAAPAAKQAALQKMHEWFQNQSGWLLVLDNADDLNALAPHFPRHHTGSLLLTTRSRNTIRWAGPIELCKFAPAEGALLLLRRAGLLDTRQTLDEISSEFRQAAMELSEELDGLPLALDQAGAYLAETTLSLPEYRARYRRHGLTLLDTVQDDHKSVTVTFGLALEQVTKRGRPGQAAANLVRLCAFLAPDAIPEAIFTTYPFEADDSASPLPALDYFEVRAAACAYSLLSREPNNSTLSVHRLVQKVTRETLNEEERRIWAERALRAVSAATPDFAFEDWPLCDLLLPHWRLCAESIHKDAIESAPAAYLLYQAGRYLRERALYAEAETFLQRALRIAEMVHGERHRVTSDIVEDLACMYRQLDRCEEAEPLHQRALEISEEVDGPEHPLTAGRLHNMALLYTEQQEYVRAEALFLRALAIHEKQPQPDYPIMAAALTQLAGVYRSQGCCDKAEPYSRRALEIYEKTLEPNHVDIATGCNNLGLLCLFLGRHAESEALFRRALKINEAARGKEHPETGTVLWGLALVQWKQGESKEADELFQNAINIYLHHFGEQHARTARLLSFYADFQKETRHVPP